MENKEFNEAKLIGFRSAKTAVVIGIFAAAWAAVLGISIGFLPRSPFVFALLALISAAIVIFCGYEEVMFLKTNKELIKVNEQKIFFFAEKKWRAVKHVDVAEIYTASTMASTFSSLKGLIDFSSLTIKLRNGKEYKIKFLCRPDEIKKEIENYKALT